MTTSDATPPRQPALPAAESPAAEVSGHWLLARLGKRVLRPGGAALTATLLDRANVAGVDVVELAPGLGRTARDILDRRPHSYIGVDADPDAAAAVGRIIGGRGRTVVSDAAATGLPDACADVVIGERWMRTARISALSASSSVARVRGTGCGLAGSSPVLPPALANAPEPLRAPGHSPRT
jgi:hypothetical protein